MRDRLRFLWRDAHTRVLILVILVLICIGLASSWKTAHESKTESLEREASTDTIIPAGFVLVPVEIQNIEALSALVGGFGLVDLFTTSQLTQKAGLRVGRRLKLIRAPLNPQSFAVLVPESEAGEILSAQGPFTAVIQNPANKNPTEIISKRKTSSSIEYYHGGPK